MKKRLTAFLFCIVILTGILPVAVHAVTMEDIPESIGAPAYVGVGTYPYYPYDGEIECFELEFSGDENLRRVGRMLENEEMHELGLSSFGLSIQVDYKYNEDGKWQYSPDWDTGGAPYQIGIGINSQMNTNGYSVNGTELVPVIDNHDDLVENTIYFRLRYVLGYYNENTGESTEIFSPWSETVMYGKNAPNQKVSRIEAPVLKKVELKRDDDGAPYFEANIVIPDSIKLLNNGQGSVGIQYAVKKQGGEWIESGTSAGMIPEISYFYPEDIGEIGEINIEEATYDIRIRFWYSYVYAGSEGVYSPYSNVLSIGTPAYYKKASGWAVEELDKAAGYGLITDRIKEDMQAPVTREEFAELAVKLYEALTGETPAYSENPFVDTDNPEILKAAAQGIVNGVGQGKFAPNQLVTRQEICCMVHRAVTACRPNADFSTTGVGLFTDEEEISSWAINSVRYMYKNKLMTGIAPNTVGPKVNTPREQAVIFVKRAYEKYK